MKLPQLCECDSFDCSKSITMSYEENLKIKSTIPKSVIIVHGCLTGPNSTDVLIEKKSGYSIYKEG